MSERSDERTVDGDDGDLDDGLDGGAGLDAGADPDLGTGPDVGAGADAGLDDEDLGVDVEALTGEPDAAADTADGTATSSRTSWLSRLTPSVSTPSPSDRLPSLRSVLLSFGVLLASTIGFGMIPLLGAASGLLGVFAGAFVLGLVSGTRRYLALAIGGAAIAGVSALQGVFQIALLSEVGLAPFAAVGAGTGLLAALLGHYFGRDLRDGLTRGVE